MKTALSIFSVIAFIAILGFAGNCDRVDSIIYNMPDETYKEIKKELSCHGREPSDSQIAEYFLDKYNP